MQLLQPSGCLRLQLPSAPFSIANSERCCFPKHAEDPSSSWLRRRGCFHSWLKVFPPQQLLSCLWSVAVGPEFYFIWGCFFFLSQRNRPIMEIKIALQWCKYQRWQNLSGSFLWGKKRMKLCAASFITNRLVNVSNSELFRMPGLLTPTTIGEQNRHPDGTCFLKKFFGSGAHPYVRVSEHFLSWISSCWIYARKLFRNLFQH